MSRRAIKLVVVTYAPTILKDGLFQSYPPYVDEMDVWFKYADEVKIIAPFTRPFALFLKPFASQKISRYYIPFISAHNISYLLLSIIKFPIVIFQLFRAMIWANHIHLRCPGNVSLLGCIVQIFFPNKRKSTKYAGNWDPNSNQPWTYRLQQTILRNTFLTQNMQVLVYGEWPNETKNIVPFMTASYYDAEKISFEPKDYSKTLGFVFTGMLVEGKRPLLTIQIIEALYQKGVSVLLHIYGDGPLMPQLKAYVKTNNLEAVVLFYGNCEKKVIKAALIAAHFSILPSKSEGWPKAIAEGMFFGCIPIATRVSCVGWMLGEGTRGILIQPELEAAVAQIVVVLEHENLNAMSEGTMRWSQQYTFDRLEKGIKKILIP